MVAKVAFSTGKVRYVSNSTDRAFQQTSRGGFLEKLFSLLASFLVKKKKKGKAKCNLVLGLILKITSGP